MATREEKFAFLQARMNGRSPEGAEPAPAAARPARTREEKIAFIQAQQAAAPASAEKPKEQGVLDRLAEM